MAASAAFLPGGAGGTPSRSGSAGTARSAAQTGSQARAAAAGSPTAQPNADNRVERPSASLDRPESNQPPFQPQQNQPLGNQAATAQSSGDDLKATSSGGLRVQVTTGRGAEPVPGAHVTVSRIENGEDILYELAVTGDDGNTPILKLPAISGTASQTPGVSHPFTDYNIRVEKARFFVFNAYNVPIYGGVLALQTVDLVPLPENYTGDINVEIYESGPQDL